MRLARIGLIVALLLLATALVVLPSAGAEARTHVSGSSDAVSIDTSGCPGFVSPQSYFIPAGDTFQLPGLWSYSYLPGGPNATNVKGRLEGRGVDANTGLSYKLKGKFAEDTFFTDIIGVGQFVIKRSDGARMSFKADFNLFGPRSPELFVVGNVTCS
jgi:hypothetical protein